MRDGGPLMWLLLLCSVLATAVFLERLFHYHRASINTSDFMKGLRNVLKRKNIAEAVSICDETPGPVAHILRAAILRYPASREDVRESIEDAGLSEVPRLERNLVVLATIAHIAPLLGLLGTVLGMIGVFQEIHMHGGVVVTSDLASGIWQALLTTAGGLTVAIPAYVAYNYLVSRVDGLVLDMEKCATEIVHLLTSEDPYELEHDRD
ncbi:MAG: MotA/TolQ/ExbB proton channel family protein [Verrucomicrobiota bacterium]|nr:MotA/TolQ/ExbB proton channel family protein [Verrucomicrobiota bacterium]MDI9384584.1 MotA/TolQ/ExbB proton channel family protein [Verrucomicrobiota bacterium]